MQVALASSASGVYVITGAHEERIAKVLLHEPVSFAHNPNFDQGLSSSIRRGLSALPMDTDAVMIFHGNASAPSTITINALIAAFNPQRNQILCVALRNGRRDNPVLIGRRFFTELHELEGDIGARYLLGTYPEEVAEIMICDL